VVVFASDNGAEKFTWPEGGTSPFRGEKGLGWEGGFRAPLLIRWPGKIAPQQVLNGIVSLEDIVPTMMAAGVPDIKEHLPNDHRAGDKFFRVHFDGYNQLPCLTGEVDESPRQSSSTTASMIYSHFATTIGKCISRSRTTGSPAPCYVPRSRGRSTCGSARWNRTWTRPLSPLCRREAVDGATRRRDHPATCGDVRADSRARRRPTSIHKESSIKRCAPKPTTDVTRIDR
jgi:hypothetical protein